MLWEASEGRHTNHNHRKLVNLITRTTALSNSMKLSHAMWVYPRWAGQGGKVWQNVVHWRREWQTTLVFLPWEPHEQYVGGYIVIKWMKRMAGLDVSKATWPWGESLIKWVFNTEWWKLTWSHLLSWELWLLIYTEGILSLSLSDIPNSGEVTFLFSMRTSDIPPGLQ